MSEDKVYYGEVIFFSPGKGYGFIKWSDENGAEQKDMFVHFSDIKMEGFKTLYKKQRVSFTLGINRHGDAKAVNVLILYN